MSRTVLHLVVRFSDNLFSIGDVISKHNEVVEKQGYVWFGKIGSTLSSTRIDSLNNQIREDVPTYIYLVKGNRRKSTIYRASLLSVSKELPKGELRKVPSYYSTKGLRQYMNAWMRIAEISEVEPSSMKNLKAISSIFPIQETLARSSSGHFLVHEAEDAF
jgi:hypothetical protein